MTRTIEQVLSYRSDMSTFLVHLTRDKDGQNASDCLKQIITAWNLVAGDAQGPAAPRMRAAGRADTSQKVVCFTETPFEHVKLLTEPITGRACQFSSYGIAITKKQGRKRGVNPVWYLDQTAGQQARWLNRDMETLVDAAIANPTIIELQRIFFLAPFIEQMGTWSTSRKEFWWEREWRFNGDLDLPDRVVLLCPEGDFADMAAHAESVGRLPNCAMIDPCWSLERMIAHLAGFNPRDASSP